MSSTQPVAELLQAATRPMEDARGMPPSVYTSAEFLERELETIFAKEWVCVGRAEGLANPGDYLTYDLAGQPVVVIRDKSGQLRAFSNVCLHRMSTIVEGTGNKRLLVCPYHAWTYDLEGRLRGAPFMTRTTGFCKENYALPQIRCEKWLGWIYITLDKDRPSVASALGELQRMIAPYQMENYVECFRETHVWDTNWKVLAENFMESYHLPVCHAATVGGHSRLEEMDCPPGLRAFNYHWITKEASLAIGNAHPDNTRLTGDWRKTTALITLYPSHLITLTPGYFWYLSLHPKGTGQVSMVFGGGLSPEFMADPRAEEYVASLKTLLDEVNAEDRGCTEKVFRGLNADAARAGHLSYLERPIYDFMQYIAERTAGFERSFPLAAE
ncbi:Phenylpropionate dioxygenase, large terminal subunit [Paracoccus alcaliphilus]|uniref:Phenylpropionate dioxygenase, large terminal subunit n=1 Tax=Paracoccus alcaliphilus TaxID=34002 RepID=A0A1H8LC35_9RHOB|nr:SRPBCC family protein [Paracoccus alcaliphilus]WCR20182.1 Rieske 2Fe-2S domain-containing protein [Paracoccus alcaliphilus]SEO02705.1 Phenylpropionate dioxygenase, large terminal subunit [Paracoccus alcaliphilus]